MYPTNKSFLKIQQQNQNNGLLLPQTHQLSNIWLEYDFKRYQNLQTLVFSHYTRKCKCPANSENYVQFEPSFSFFCLVFGYDIQWIVADTTVLGCKTNNIFKKKLVVKFSWRGIVTFSQCS